MAKRIRSRSRATKEFTKPLVVDVRGRKRLAFGKNQARRIAEFFSLASGNFDPLYMTEGYWRNICNGAFHRSADGVVVTAVITGTRSDGRTQIRIESLRSRPFCAGRCSHGRSAKAEMTNNGLRCFCHAA